MLTQLKWMLPAAIACALLVGCKSETATPGDNDGDDAHADHDGHDHGHHHEPGPHDGEVFTLGKEDYHVELVETSEEVLTLYILDHAIEKEVPVSESGVKLSLMVEGEPKQYDLVAVQPKNGMASQFTLEDAAAAHAIHEEGSKAKLTVDIAGKQYVAELEHDCAHDHGHGDHAHDDHDHEHGDDHAHDDDH